MWGRFAAQSRWSEGLVFLLYRGGKLRIRGLRAVVKGMLHKFDRGVSNLGALTLSLPCSQRHCQARLCGSMAPAPDGRATEAWLHPPGWAGSTRGRDRNCNAADSGTGPAPQLAFGVQHRCSGASPVLWKTSKRRTTAEHCPCWGQNLAGTILCPPMTP